MAAVNRSIVELSRLADVGRRLLDDAISQREIARICREHGVDPANTKTKYTARTIAQAFSEAEIQRIIRTANQYKCKNVLSVVFEVSKWKGANRLQVAEKALKRRWSIRNLKDFISRHGGRQHQGGRRPQLSTDQQTLRYQLAQACQTWLRIVHDLQQPLETKRSSNSTRIDFLPKRVRTKLISISKGLQYVLEQLKQ